MHEELRKKLKLDKFTSILLYRPAREASPFDALGLPAKTDDQADLILAYVYTLAEMKQSIESLWASHALAENGCIYFFYPKIKNPLGHAPIGRDEIFPYLGVDDSDGYAQNCEYKFNKMQALDENYTLIGLKYLSRAKQKPRNAPSQSVGDYTDKVGDVRACLAQYPSELAFFDALAPGYQRDWARYLYSARTATTLAKRQAEMLDILRAGYKTKQLYREKKR